MPQDAVAVAIASARTRLRAGRRKSRNIGADANTRTACHSRALAMTDTEFIAATDRVLSTIGEALDAALAHSDLDVDWNVNDGILEIECEDGGKLIVNRHVPNREIWVAAKSGGFHFRVDGNRWQDTRSADELGAVLERLLAEQAGLAVRLHPLSV
jgi:CyaY protein